MSAKKNRPSPATKTRRAASKRPAPVIRPAIKRDAPSVSGARSASTPGTQALCKEIALLRESVSALVGRSQIGVTADEVSALRRVLADILESRMLTVLQKLAAIRHAVPLDASEVVGRMDALLDELGAVSFTAERMEHLDPVIHEVGREVRDGHLPDGVIAATLRPGWRTANGQILARCLVSLNRRA